MPFDAFQQRDMFTGDLVDLRSQRQKERDGKQAWQVEMFSQRELAQFGVRARPRLSITPATRLELSGQDPLTKEEQEQAAQRAAEKNTFPMFEAPGVAEVDRAESGLLGSPYMPPSVSRGHELLPQELREQLPPLYSQEALGLSALAQIKFFTPDSNWTWYASEGSPVDADSSFDTDEEKADFLFFGLVSGLEVELGYFALSELEEARGPMGLPIERDLYFSPRTLGELQALHEQRRPG